MRPPLRGDGRRAAPARALQPDAVEAARADTVELVDRARTGDREAYGELFERYYDEIYRFATRRLGDPHAGQDAAAQTFEDAFGSLDRFRWQGAPFEAWLYTIARRRVADARRDSARAAGDEPPPPAADHVDDTLDAITIRRLLDRLPETERAVLELRVMEDLDADEVARRLRKTPGAVRVAQHRALHRLRSLLEEER